MKNSFFVLIMLTLVNLNYVYAHGDKHAEEKSEHSEHESIDKKEDMVTGQLIGLTCFVKHGSKGSSHKDCFKECAEKGLPIGVLTKDNKIYQISGEGHSELKDMNKKFLKFAEEEVVVKGKVYSSNGMNMIVISGIKKAH